MTAFKEGLGDVVPLNYLLFFSWSELEKLVVGVADINIKDLQVPIPAFQA